MDTDTLKAKIQELASAIAETTRLLGIAVVDQDDGAIGFLEGQVDALTTEQRETEARLAELEQAERDREERRKRREASAEAERERRRILDLQCRFYRQLALHTEGRAKIVEANQALLAARREACLLDSADRLSDFRAKLSDARVSLDSSVGHMDDVSDPAELRDAAARFRELAAQIEAKLPPQAANNENE